MVFPQTLIHWLLAATATAAVIFFAAGLTNFFEQPRQRPTWVRVVHNLGGALSLMQLMGVIFLPPRSEIGAAAGIVLYSLAVTVFLSAIEAARRTRLQRAFVDEPLPDRLITEGPYRWVRHPFYLGYILGAVAAPVATDSPALIVIAVMTIGLTVSAAIREERVWLKSARGAAYREYRRQTGMFLPFVG